jgi:UDPglucose 6-dehydrogenase
LKPGLGIAGGNLERDLATVTRLGDSAGTDVGLIHAFQFNSRYRREWALRTLHTLTLTHINDPQLAVIGLAYKEHTHSTKNSPAVALLDALRPYRVKAFDPVVASYAAWHPRLVSAASALEAAEGADALLVMTPWPVFGELCASDLSRVMAGKVVIDPHAVLNETDMRAEGLDYRRLGAA